jgi:hypothetical protein
MISLRRGAFVEGKDTFVTETLLYGYSIVSLNNPAKNAREEKAYITIHTAATHQFLDVRGEVIPRILLLNARRPIWLPRTYQDLLSVCGHGAIERLGVVYF